MSRVVQLEKEKAELQAAVQRYEQQLREREREIQQLQERVRLLQLLHFGPKSEKRTGMDDRTALLFNEAEDTAFPQARLPESKGRREVEVRAHRRKGGGKVGRKPLEANLPREEVVYDLSEEERKCSCGAEKVCLGEEVSERLQVIPASVKVLRERRKKYSCKACEGVETGEAGVVTAGGKKHLLAGSIADESLLAWSVTEKFEYALPFYRQEKRLEAIGVRVGRATMSSWAMQCGEACRPLYEELGEWIRQGPLLQADETRVQVLKEPGRAAQQLSWMWVFRGGGEARPAVVFQYEPHRSAEVVERFLREYRGFLQTDDYEAYHTALSRLGKPPDPGGGIRHVLCWAHVRRYFLRAWEAAKSEEAKQGIEQIGALFRLEEARRERSVEEFQAYRRQEAEKIFQAFRFWLEKVYPQFPPQGLMGKAVKYTLDNWELLVRYVEHPLLTPSNNAVENAIRPFVVGRKNWLFADTPAGAEASAILYSLIETAKLNHHRPYDYLLYVFEHLPSATTKADYQALLPFHLSPEQTTLINTEEK